MASLTASLPPLFLQSRKALLRTLQNLPVSSSPGERRNCAVVVKAISDSSESSTSLSIVKSVQNVWDKSDEDRVGLIGLGFAAIVALWASTNLISAIDKLPLIPNVLEFIGILFSSWFIYRYLLSNLIGKNCSKSSTSQSQKFLDSNVIEGVISEYQNDQPRSWYVVCIAVVIEICYVIWIFYFFENIDTYSDIDMIFRSFKYMKKFIKFEQYLYQTPIRIRHLYPNTYNIGNMAASS